MDLTWIGPTIAFAIVLTIALAAALALAGVHARRWAWGAAVTAPFQLYALPLAGVFLSVNLLSGLAALKGLSARELWKHWWLRFALLMTLAPVLAIAWSPNPVLGVRDFIYALPFFFLLGVLYRYDHQNGRSARRLLAWALVLCNVEAALVIAFRVSPALEASFIGSRWATLFISPNVLYGLFTDARNNVFDPNKAGGFFVNANVASAFLGSAAMLAWGLGRSQGWRLVTFTAFFCWVAVFFSGSKAGAMCAVAIPLGMFLIKAVREKQVSMTAVVVACFVVALIGLAAPFAWSMYQETGFTRASSETLSVRQRIWIFAWQMFKQHPLRGLGNGGWEEKYPIYALSQGLSPGYPPHNFVLMLWTKGGLLAALAGIAFAVTFFAWCVQVARDAPPAVATMAAGLAGAFLWMAIQSSAENFGLIGEPHITTLLAIAAGIVARESHRARHADG